jgi:hypothetical protein
MGLGHRNDELLALAASSTRAKQAVGRWGGGVGWWCGVGSRGLKFDYRSLLKPGSITCRKSNDVRFDLRGERNLISISTAVSFSTTKIDLRILHTTTSAVITRRRIRCSHRVNPLTFVLCSAHFVPFHFVFNDRFNLAFGLNFVACVAGN